MLIAAAVVLSLLFGLIATATTQLLCGAAPTARNLFSGLWLAASGDPAAYVTEPTCELPVTPIRVLDIVAVVLIVAAAIWIIRLVLQYRQSDRSFITDLRTRPGFAPASEIRQHLSGAAVLRRARQLRPD
ncbi:MAG: hypothetical protein J0I97_11315, partial [Microbacterium sp.]|nr:hypothetical protein [Microbacterium sp.]